MISDSNRTTELWTKQPRRDGGTRVGAIWGSAEGAALRRFGCERITPSWDALSSFAHFPNLPQASFHTAWVKPGLPPWGPHVRFRRVQTLVREGSPLVKLRDSA